MPVDECPEDEECRQTYNFPPGAIGIVYRADVPDYGAGPSTKHARKTSKSDEHGDEAEIKDEPKDDDIDEKVAAVSPITDVKYKLQPMKWGLVPSWTKRSPDYGSVMRTINARDDTIAQNSGLWNVPKRRKRCIVIAQGFYEWLKKNNGKEKIPHYIKRKDNQLMCMAGLWDCVKYEGLSPSSLGRGYRSVSLLLDSEEKTYTYTIITTDANKQMSWLHDRMPVILDNGSDAIRTWLDPNRYEWNNELQSLLKPFEGELEIYPVNKDVGKVGNNSPSFIIPLDSAENKSNIANFFGNQRKMAKDAEAKKNVVKAEEDVQSEGLGVKTEKVETRETTNQETAESNAPLPASSPRGIKREHSDSADDASIPSPEKKILKSPAVRQSPAKPVARKMKSSTSNGSAGKTGSPSKAAQGTQKITKFFGK
jgi:putative SOS response-associated peptidase YedK